MWRESTLISPEKRVGMRRTDEGVDQLMWRRWHHQDGRRRIPLDYTSKRTPVFFFEVWSSQEKKNESFPLSRGNSSGSHWRVAMTTSSSSSLSLVSSIEATLPPPLEGWRGDTWRCHDNGVFVLYMMRAAGHPIYIVRKVYGRIAPDVVVVNHSAFSFLFFLFPSPLSRGIGFRTRLLLAVQSSCQSREATARYCVQLHRISKGSRDNFFPIALRVWESYIHGRAGILSCIGKLFESVVPQIDGK